MFRAKGLARVTRFASGLAVKNCTHVLLKRSIVRALSSVKDTLVQQSVSLVEKPMDKPAEKTDVEDIDESPVQEKKEPVDELIQQSQKSEPIIIPVQETSMSEPIVIPVQQAPKKETVVASVQQEPKMDTIAELIQQGRKKELTHVQQTQKNDTNDQLDMSNPANLFVAISELEEFDIRLKSMPYIVVIGPQSAGKSAVMGTFLDCKKNILPTGMRMATMKLTRLRTIRTESERKIVVGGKTFFSEEEASDEINRMNTNPHIEAIDIVRYSPNLYNNNLRDLPGLFVVSDASAPGMPKMVKKMVVDHLKDPAAIPLLVLSAVSDPATNMGMQLVLSLDRAKDTLGVITKVDMAEQQDNRRLNELLDGSAYKLGRGYCAVVLRSADDIVNNVTIEEKKKQEKVFFANSKTKYSPCGVDVMHKSVAQMLLTKTADNMPAIVKEIDTMLDRLKHNRAFMNQSAEGKSDIPYQLAEIIETLVTSSPERTMFENALKEAIYKGILELTDKSLPADAKLGYTMDDTNWAKSVDQMRLSLGATQKDFKGFFAHGKSPLNITQNDVDIAHESECKKASLMSLVRYRINDDAGVKRVAWDDTNNKFYETLLKGGEIQKLVSQTTEKLLSEYIGRAGHNIESSSSFVSWITKKASQEVYNDKIKFALSAFLEVEKRPNVSDMDIVSELSRMYPSHFTLTSSILAKLHSAKKLQVEIFGDIWNAAQIKATRRRYAYDCYRVVVVYLLRGIVPKLIEMSFDMINKKNAQLEALKMDAKINKLTSLRRTIVSFANHYGISTTVAQPTIDQTQQIIDEFGTPKSSESSFR